MAGQGDPTGLGGGHPDFGAQRCPNATSATEHGGVGSQSCQLSFPLSSLRAGMRVPSPVAPSGSRQPHSPGALRGDRGGGTPGPTGAAGLHWWQSPRSAPVCANDCWQHGGTAPRTLPGQPGPSERAGGAQLLQEDESEPGGRGWREGGPQGDAACSQVIIAGAQGTRPAKASLLTYSWLVLRSTFF